MEHPPANPVTTTHKMENRFDSQFGGRSIKELADDIRRRLRRVSFTVSAEDLEDAVSIAILAVLDYWVEKYADLSDDGTGKRFNYASTFGVRRGREHLAEVAERAKREVHLDRSRSRRGGEWMEDEDVDAFENIHDPEPTAEERLCSDEAAAVETFKSLNGAQKRQCAKAITGKGYCNRTALHRDRKDVYRLLRTRAVKFGLA